jgi:hypothetical protein
LGIPGRCGRRLLGFGFGFGFGFAFGFGLPLNFGFPGGLGRRMLRRGFRGRVLGAMRGARILGGGFRARTVGAGRGIQVRIFGNAARAHSGGGRTMPFRTGTAGLRDRIFDLFKGRTMDGTRHGLRVRHKRIEDVPEHIPFSGIQALLEYL